MIHRTFDCRWATPSVCVSTTLRFYHFRHSRARAASGPSPIDSACPKTPRTMLDLRDRSLGRPGEAPWKGPRPSRLQPRRPRTLLSACPGGPLRATGALPRLQYIRDTPLAVLLHHNHARVCSFGLRRSSEKKLYILRIRVVEV